jgi:hypothetical protein
LSNWVQRLRSRGALPQGGFMTLDSAVLSFAGTVVLVGLALGYFVNPLWFLLTVFAGLNMLQAGITGFCPAAMVFKKLGVKAGSAFN